MDLSGELFFAEARKVVDRLEAEQMDNIKKAAQIIAKSIMDDGVLHVFGPGHSMCFAKELVHRAGGLVPTDAMLLDDLITLAEDPLTYEELCNPETERNPENGLKIWKLHNIQPQDVLICCSNSGRNGAVVEIAMEAKRNNIPTIAVTSLEHSGKVTSRHPSGKKLYEVADLVIDNCGPYGDALLEAPGLPMRVCSISSVSNGFIAQALNAEVIRDLINAGYKPPVYISANVDGADEHNRALREKYAGRTFG